MAEQKKTTGAAGKKDSGAGKPAGKSAPKPASKSAPKPSSKPSPKPSPKKDERASGSKPAARKPAAAGKKGDASTKDRPSAERKRDAGGKPAAKPARKKDERSSGSKPAAKDRPSAERKRDAGGKSAPAGKKPAAKPASKSAPKRDERPAGSKPAVKSGPKKPAAAGKKPTGAAKSRPAGDRKRPDWDKPEPKAAKPRKPTPRKGEGGAPKRLPKEAVLAGAPLQPKTVKRPGTRKAQRPDPASVRAAMIQVADWLHAKKALDIVALDVSGLCSVAEGLVLATARNVRQAQGLADHVLKAAGEAGISYLGMEGYRAGGWVLLDLNDVLVHIFQEDTRRFYNLEGLWADAAPVELDLGPDDDGPGDDHA